MAKGSATTERSVVIVSPHFPPATVAGVHRARHLAKHLPVFGWRPIVVRAREADYAESIDPALGSLVPASVQQVRTPALPLGLTRSLGVGDIGIRTFPYLSATLDRIIAQERPSAIFITGFPFYPMLLAPRLKRRYGLPVVLDFQDPWVSAYGAERPALSKARMAHRLAVFLEPKAVRAASFITSVSETQNAQMAMRYPWLDATRMAAIPIGGDPDDFDALRGAWLRDPQARLAEGHINLSYVGAFLPRSGPLAQVLFAALADLRREQPALAARLRLNFVGSSNQPDDRSTFQVRPLAAQAGVDDLVREVPQRVPFLEALNLLATSQGLLLIGSDEPHYTASKIYPALMSKTPFLSLFNDNSSAHRILSAAGGGVSLSFDDADSLAALRGPLKDALLTLATKPKSLGLSDPSAYAAYTAQAVAGQFAAIFDRLADHD